MIWIVGIGVFCFLLFMFPKKVILLILGIGAIGALLVGYFQFQEWQERTRRAKVEVEASFDPKICSDPKYPILILVYSRSTETLESMGMSLEAFKDGYSSEQYSSYISSDKIIKPNEHYATCWSLSDYSWRTENKIPLGLEWKVQISSIKWSQ